MLEPATIEKVLNRIEKESLLALLLSLGNIDSPSGQEKAVSDFIYDWMDKNGLNPKRMALVPDRPNVVGKCPGNGTGYSLIFNSHMDTAVANDESAGYINPTDPIYHKAWVEGDYICGHGIVNDKGPMAAWLIAAGAIKSSGIKLPGDILLNAVVGEITREPVDEYASPEYLGKETGTRYTITHGAIADYAIVAEGTAFCPIWVEAGKAFFKVTVYGDTPLYTPFIQRPVPLEKNPNAIVRMAKLIEALEDWACDYQEKNKYECPGGIVIPKVNIGAIRGGAPFRITRTLQLCHMYIDVRLSPGQDPLKVKNEITRLLKKLNFDGGVELFLYRRGYEAQNVSRLVDSIKKATSRFLKEPPQSTGHQVSSMWRDINPYNEMGIPAVTFGPGSGTGGGVNKMAIEHLLWISKIYALVALDICSQPKFAEV